MQQRLHDLDADPYRHRERGGLLADIRHYIDVIGSVTDNGRPGLEISARGADEMLAASKLIRYLKKNIPEITNGPLRLDAQYWIGTEKSPDTRKQGFPLHETYFIDAMTAERETTVKPWHFALFTSTAFLGTYGMWRMYLECGGESTLFPKPWAVWSVKPKATVKIREIESAEDWEKLILAYPRRGKGGLFPDWQRIAHGIEGYDAVHMTLQAIAALQGFPLKTTEGLIAPSYWDIETTIWFHWCFETVSLVEKIPFILE